MTYVKKLWHLKSNYIQKRGQHSRYINREGTKGPYSMSEQSLNMKGVRIKATCNQSSIWDRLNRTKVLPCGVPLSYVATSKEYGDGNGGTTWKAKREERSVTPTLIQSGRP